MAVLFSLSLPAYSQVFLESGPGGGTTDGMLIVYGAGNLPNSVPYEKIKGSPFWNDQWKPAVLYADNNKTYGLYSVRINLATNELHYLSKNGEELVASARDVKRIVFYEDSTAGKILTVFRNDFPEISWLNKEHPDNYVQILNEGNARLLKQVIRKVNVGDSLFGTQKRYFFSDHSYYYMQYNLRIERIQKLNKDEIFALLPGSLSFAVWLKQNKIELTKEAGVLRFLEYYNSRFNKEE